MTPEQRIDAALDSVLKASGSALRHYTMPKTLADMREAMRKVMFDEYIRGLNDNVEAIKKAGPSDQHNRPASAGPKKQEPNPPPADLRCCANCAHWHKKEYIHCQCSGPWGGNVFGDKNCTFRARSVND